MTPAADRERAGRGGMTVEECVDATILAASTFYRDPERWMEDAPWLEVYGMQQRYTDTLLEQAESHMDNARYLRDVGRPVAMRYHLVQWRICREATRAIERERSK